MLRPALCILVSSKVPPIVCAQNVSHRRPDGGLCANCRVSFARASAVAHLHHAPNRPHVLQSDQRPHQWDFPARFQPVSGRGRGCPCADNRFYLLLRGRWRNGQRPCAQRSFAPNQLQSMLELFERGYRRGNYNELVVSSEYWIAKLPGIINFFTRTWA